MCVYCEKQNRLSGWYLYWVQVLWFERRVQWWHWNDMMVSLSLMANYKETLSPTSSLQHAATHERWATLKTVRGLWLNSNLRGYKSMIRQQQPLWCTVRARTDHSCTTCWVGSLFCWLDDHQCSYLLLPKRFISLVHRVWIHLSSLFSATCCSVFKTFFEWLS